MIKTYKNFLIALALLPLSAFAQQPMINIQVLDTDPVPGTTLHANEPMYVRLQYQIDRPMRFQLAGFQDGAKVEESASLNPAPAYQAGSGEAVAWIAYSEKADINEFQVIVYDENWETVYSIPLPVQMHWSGRPSKNWRQPAEWAQALTRQQQLLAADSTEQPPAQPVENAAGAAGDVESPLPQWALPLAGVIVVILVIVLLVKRKSK